MKQKECHLCGGRGWLYYPVPSPDRKLPISWYKATKLCPNGCFINRGGAEKLKQEMIDHIDNELKPYMRNYDQ